MRPHLMNRFYPVLFRWSLWVAFLVPLPVLARKATPPQQVEVAPLWPQVAIATVDLLENQHYLRRSVDGGFSRRALERYLEILDPAHLYFLKDDVESFRKSYGDTFGPELKAGKSAAAFAIHARFTERVLACSEVVQSLLAEPWDFSAPWVTEMIREHAPWPLDEQDSKRVWREQMGAEMLAEILEGSSLAVAVDRAKKHQEQARKSAVGATEKDRWACALLAMARACDAHSDYLTQDELEDEESELRLTRVGIGVTLNGDPAGVRVSGLLTGGPAHRDGRLKVNDRIIAVAEESGPFFEMDGLPLGKALSLLRGQKGTLVKLKVAPARASDPAQRTVIALQRDEMRSSEGEAYAKILERKHSSGGILRLGWISVPGFYGDDSDSVGRRGSSVAKDVSVLINRLKSEHIAGLVLDFRGNLGGLLDEAIELGGLFVGKAPIALVRSQAAGVEVLAPTKLRRPKYDGPMVVLTDRSSASASELVSGALQDYGRAAVVGAEQTFGKGSVQMTVQLGEYLRGKNRQPVGGLALSVGKFYRVNGQSTQLLGVRPDIILPSSSDLPTEGESALIDPLPHDAISPVVTPNRAQVSAETIRKLQSGSARRVSESAEFKAITQDRDRGLRNLEKNQISLQESVRRDETEALRRRYSERESGMAANAAKGRFFRVLLEDTKLKKLRGSDLDPLASLDPESVAVEAEVFQILEDLVLERSR